MKQNARIQNQIIDILTNLMHIKILESFQESPDEKFSIVEDMSFDYKIYTNQYGDHDHMVVLVEKPKYIVEIARRFVEKVKETSQQEFYNRAIYYYPALTQNSEIGVIDYLEILFKKLYT